MATPSQTQVTPVIAPTSVPQVIQIQIPTEALKASPDAANSSPTFHGGIETAVVLISFAVLLKVAMGYLKPDA